jgi:membrane-bound serine protease (ClpP class)
VSIAIGTIILFPPLRPTFPGFRYTVDPLVVAFVVLLSAGFFLFLVRAARRLLGLPVATGASLLLGAIGVAKSDIAPRGIAYVAGEDWTAISEAGAIPKGSPVRVKRVDSIRLIVEPARGAEGRGTS